MGGFTRDDVRWIMVRLFSIAVAIAALLLLVYIIGGLKPPATPVTRSARPSMEQLPDAGRVEDPQGTS